MKLEFSRQIFEEKKSLNVKFHQYSSSGSRGVSCGRTDGYDEADSRFSQFCACPYKLLAICRHPSAILKPVSIPPAIKISSIRYVVDQTFVVTKQAKIGVSPNTGGCFRHFETSSTY